ncbi:hypothetical protein [Paenibacillus gansuensis]|uniref:Uncharacterized protein n=1 Tax=Paenibacillus gansuensis TaxID=306542 RepID=A0ABW5PGS6_9BACL
MLKRIKKFASMLLQGIDDLVDKNNNVLKRGLYEDLRRQNQIGVQVVKGNHTLDDLIEVEMIDKKHNP